MALDRDFVSFSARKLAQLASRIEDCLGRLTREQLWWRAEENQNAIGNLVLHLCGNVRQWIISGVGRVPDVRDRDAEFAARNGGTPADLASLLAGTVREAVEVIGGLEGDRLGQRVLIQGYDVTVLEAVYTCVEHFSQHTGQILYATKLATGADLGYYAHLRRPAHGEPTP
jgi:hypothetical protein